MEDMTSHLPAMDLALEAVDMDLVIEELEDRAQPLPPITCGCSCSCDCTSCCCGPSW